MARASDHASQAGPLVFDGDRATFSFTVKAPNAPFGVTQTASCPSVPTVGVPSTCTITESITNNGPHTLDFTNTAVNHLANNVRAVSATTSSGTIVTSGSSVTWNNFNVASGQTVTASVQVTFTPTASQVGSQIVLSNSITADARDIVTGQVFKITANGVSTPSRVVKAGGAAPSGTSGAGGTTSTGVSGLPQTGGAARQASLRRWGAGAPSR
jgi:hypothetical protein